MLLETAGLNATELSAYCRQKGLYPKQVDCWRQAAQGAIEKPVLTITEQKELEKLRRPGPAGDQSSQAGAEAQGEGVGGSRSFIDAAKKVGGLLPRGRGRLTRAGHRRKAIDTINEVAWTPKTEPVVMRASQEARLAQEKPHEVQAPHTRTDHPQAAHR